MFIDYFCTDDEIGEKRIWKLGESYLGQGVQINACNRQLLFFFFYLASRWLRFVISSARKVQTKLRKSKQSIWKSNVSQKHQNVCRLTNVNWIPWSGTFHLSRMKDKSYILLNESQRAGSAWMHLNCFSVTLAVSQRPLLIIIEVGVSSDPWPRSKGVSQEAIFPVEGVTIPVLCRWHHSALTLQDNTPKSFFFSQTATTGAAGKLCILAGQYLCLYELFLAIFVSESTVSHALKWLLVFVFRCNYQIPARQGQLWRDGLMLWHRERISNGCLNWSDPWKDHNSNYCINCSLNVG